MREVSRFTCPCLLLTIKIPSFSFCTSLVSSLLTTTEEGDPEVEKGIHSIQGTTGTAEITEIDVTAETTVTVVIVDLVDIETDAMTETDAEETEGNRQKDTRALITTEAVYQIPPRPQTTNPNNHPQ